MVDGVIVWPLAVWRRNPSEATVRINSKVGLSAAVCSSPVGREVNQVTSDLLQDRPPVLFALEPVHQLVQIWSREPGKVRLGRLEDDIEDASKVTVGGTLKASSGTTCQILLEKTG